MTYSSREAFDLYIYYIALKRHFTSSYDFFKYNGKVNATQSSFEKRRDRFFFYKLSKKDDAKNRVLSTMVYDPKTWIGSIVDDESIYLEWKKRTSSLSYTVKNDMRAFDDINEALTPVDGNHPPIIREYITEKVSLETLVILNGMFGLLRKWDKLVDDTIIYPPIKSKIEKYSPFLKYDKAKIKSTLFNMYA